MYQLEPVLGTTASSTFSYFEPLNPEPAIPRGIVEKRRQIFVEKPHTSTVFETPTTSSDENTYNRTYYPIYRINRPDVFHSPRKPQISAHLRVYPPPPSFSDNNKKAKNPNNDMSRFVESAPNDLVKGGPVWINSGPIPPTRKYMNNCSQWSPPKENNKINRYPIITRYLRSYSNHLPTLTINVSSGKEFNYNDRTNNFDQVDTDITDRLSCQTDWKYYESHQNENHVNFDLYAPKKDQPIIIRRYYETPDQINKMEGLQESSSRNYDTTSLGSSRRTSDDHGSIGSDSSQIMSMHEQIVRYSAKGTSTHPNDHQSIEEAVMSDRETSLVVRLERELTEAQQTNHRLNQHLKTLTNSNTSAIKKELINTKKQLKEKTDEANQYKQQLGRTKSELSMWLSRKPDDRGDTIESLTNEKQELRKQLEREQNEKQELFLQMNDLISQVANGCDKGELMKLQAEVTSLKRELDVEKKSGSNETNHLKEQLAKTKEQLRIYEESQREREQQKQNEIDELNEQLQIKTAALESMRIANNDSGKLLALRSENEEQAQEIRSLKSKLTKLDIDLIHKQNEIDRLNDKNSTDTVAQQVTNDIQLKLQQVEERLKEEKQQKERLEQQTQQLMSALADSEETFKNMKANVQKLEEEAARQRHENETEKLSNNSSLQSLTNRVTSLLDELKSEKHNNEIIQAQLNDKTSKLDAVNTELLTANSKYKQAEEDMKQLETKANEIERKLHLAEDQLNSRDNDTQIEILKQAMQSAQSRNEVLQQQLNQSQLKIKDLEEERMKKDEVEDSLRQVNEQLQAKVESVHKENQDNSQAIQDKLTHMNFVIENMEKEKAERDEQIKLMSRKIEEYERTETDRRNAASASTLEIETLTSALESIRIQNSNYEEQLNTLTSELQSTRRHLQQKEDECENLLKTNKTMEDKLEELNQLQNAANQHDTEVFELKSQLDKEKYEYLDQISTLKDNTLKNEREIKELREKCEMLTDENKRLAEWTSSVEKSNTSELEHVEQELKQSKSRSESLAKQLEESTSFNKNLVEEIESIREQLRSANNEKSSIQSHYEENEKKLNIHEQECSALQDEIQRKDRKINELTLNFELKQEEFDRLQRKVDEISQKLEQETTAHHETKTASAQLTKELEHAKWNQNTESPRVAELTAENTRLTNELVKVNMETERLLREEREKLRANFEQQLQAVNGEKIRLRTDLQEAEAAKKSLLSQIDDTNIRLADAEKSYTDYMDSRQTYSAYAYNDGPTRVYQSMLQSNGPVAPPRSTRTISNMSSLTNWTAHDFTDCDDLDKLKGEIDKQKRLILVLRRKLKKVETMLK